MNEYLQTATRVLEICMDLRWLLIFLLMGLGTALKSVPQSLCPNWCIPFVLLIVGAFAGTYVLGDRVAGIFFGAACGVSSSWLYDHIFRPLSDWILAKAPWAKKED